MTPADDGDATGPGDSRGISVLRNGIAVLRAFSADEPALGVTAIAARVGLHKSTVSRILATLQQADLVERDAETGRFRLGLGVIALAGPLLADLDVRRAAYPLLEDLSRRTGETAALMVWNGSEAVCVEQVPSRHQVKHTTPLGMRYRTVLDASVAVFLTQSDASQVRRMLADNTIASVGLDEDGVEAYVAQLAAARERGFTVNYGETSLEEVGVAAPIFDHRGEPVAAVLVSAPRFRVSAEQLPVLGEAVRLTADQVTARLGSPRVRLSEGPGPLRVGQLG